MRIYLFLRRMDRDIFRFKSSQISRLYLWKANMWNALLVEGTGWIIYSTILFFVYGNLWFSVLLPAPLSFITKYLIYDRWLFRKNTLKGSEQEK